MLRDFDCCYGCCPSHYSFVGGVSYLTVGGGVGIIHSQSWPLDYADTQPMWPFPIRENVFEKVVTVTEELHDRDTVGATWSQRAQVFGLLAIWQSLPRFCCFLSNEKEHQLKDLPKKDRRREIV